MNDKDRIELVAMGIVAAVTEQSHAQIVVMACQLTAEMVVQTLREVGKTEAASFIDAHWDELGEVITTRLSNAFEEVEAEQDAENVVPFGEVIH